MTRSPCRPDTTNSNRHRPTKTSCSAPAPERYPHVVTLNASEQACVGGGGPGAVGFAVKAPRSMRRVANGGASAQIALAAQLGPKF